jgi:hypothetical protein
MLVLVVVVSSGCEDKKKEKKQVYFDDLRPPAGAKATIVRDESFNRAAGGETIVRIAVMPDIDRDNLDRLMRSLYRQLKGRAGFKKGGEVETIDLRIYTSKAKAKAGGDDWLASVSRRSKSDKPVFSNKQKLPLLKWVKKALGRMPQYTGSIKPRILVDADRLTAEVTLPFVEEDGSGKWVKKVTYNRATTTLTSTVRAIFGKVEKIKKLTFIGTHEGKQLIKVTLTRPQAAQLNLRQVEESVSAFAGKFVNQLKMDKKAERKIKKFRRKVYKEALGRLPKEQVFIDKKALE